MLPQWGKEEWVLSFQPDSVCFPPCLRSGQYRAGEVQGWGRRVSRGNAAAERRCHHLPNIKWAAHFYTNVEICEKNTPFKKAQINYRHFIVKLKVFLISPGSLANKDHTWLFSPSHLSLPHQSHGCKGEAKWGVVLAVKVELERIRWFLFFSFIQMVFTECLLF